MSVFTTLNFDEVAEWLGQFNIGQLVLLKGIAAGITNTNYFVTTTQNKFVLTIFEQNKAEELPYFVDLMAHLSANGVLCPKPIFDQNQQALHQLHCKPAMMVSCLQGSDIAIPTIGHIEQVARELACMHAQGANYNAVSINQRDANWRNNTAQKVLSKLSLADQELLTNELAYQQQVEYSQLPIGVIHGDLFRDNVLFYQDKLAGFIDFYYACDDVLAYDIAIAMNEWCVHHNGADIGSFDQEKAHAFCIAYEEVRTLSRAEHARMHDLLRLAALRFWLSRLHDFHFPAKGELTHTKDPNHFKSILQQHLVSL